ncbi:MAG: TolB family protein, partial [Planctomycetota bacterium]
MVRSIESRTRPTAMLGVFTLVCVLGTAEADFIFGEAANLGPTVNSPAIDGHPSISTDGLSLFFYSERSGGYGDRDIWLARRAGIDEGWTSLENVGPPVNTPYRDSAPSISADGLMLFFDSDRPGGSGGPDIWVATRETKDDPWASPVNLGSVVNSPAYDYYASVSADGLVLFFDSGRGGAGEKVWMTTRETRDSPWTEPVILGARVNSSAGDGEARISPDGLALFFGSKRPGGYGGGWNAWVTTRATADSDWGPPMNLGPTINSPSGAAGAIPSADGSTIYFASPRSGLVDLWQAPIARLVDFNGDGQVNGFEVFAMADRWGTDDSLCDIGPSVFGDGTVDVRDLKVLAEYIGEEVYDPTLVAHWALDETEGGIAY